MKDNETQNPSDAKTKTKNKKSKNKKPKLDSSMTSLEQKVEAINAKLNDILTKKDKDFIKNILIDTLEEMKDKIIGSVLLRVEKLEGELHEKCIEQTELKNKIQNQSQMKKEIQECTKKNSELNDENTKLKKELKSEIDTRKEKMNELEQYGRRNNVRLSGLDFDNKHETSQATIDGVIGIFNDTMGLDLSPYDIDIAHRLGKYDNKKIRAVIIKFVSRQTKYLVMKNAKHLKGTKLSLNEDLTRMNQQVLASMRLKDKDNITKAWSFEGKLYRTNKKGITELVPFAEFQMWLDKKWPEEVVP